MGKSKQRAKRENSQTGVKGGTAFPAVVGIAVALAVLACTLLQGGFRLHLEPPKSIPPEGVGKSKEILSSAAKSKDIAKARANSGVEVKTSQQETPCGKRDLTHPEGPSLSCTPSATWVWITQLAGAAGVSPRRGTANRSPGRCDRSARPSAMLGRG